MITISLLKSLFYGKLWNYFERNCAWSLKELKQKSKKKLLLILIKLAINKI